MKAKNQNKQSREQAPNTNASEFTKARWSVITYESVAVSNLTYAEALEWVKKLDEQKISGLCIITDEAAARISSSSRLFQKPDC